MNWTRSYYYFYSDDKKKLENFRKFLFNLLKEKDANPEEDNFFTWTTVMNKLRIEDKDKVKGSGVILDVSEVKHDEQGAYFEVMANDIDSANPYIVKSILKYFSEIDFRFSSQPLDDADGPITTDLEGRFDKRKYFLEFNIPNDQKLGGCDTKTETEAIKIIDWLSKSSESQSFKEAVNKLDKYLKNSKIENTFYLIVKKFILVDPTSLEYLDPIIGEKGEDVVVDYYLDNRGVA